MEAAQSLRVMSSEVAGTRGIEVARIREAHGTTIHRCVFLISHQLRWPETCKRGFLPSSWRSSALPPSFLPGSISKRSGKFLLPTMAFGGSKTAATCVAQRVDADGAGAEGRHQAGRPADRGRRPRCHQCRQPGAATVSHRRLVEGRPTRWCARACPSKRR